MMAKLKYWFTPQRSNNYRPKVLQPDSLLVIAFVAIGFFALIQTVRFFPSLKNSVLGFSSSITVEQVVAQTNEQRKQQGLKPLVLDSRLSAAALAKAQDMLDNQYWAHTSPAGKQPWDFMKAANYRYRVAGENLARDFHQTTDMVKAWMASPTHKANIVNDQYQEIGVAVVNGELEGFETTLVVQMFGAPVAQTASIDQSASSTQADITTAQAEETSVAQQTAESNSMHNPIQAIEDKQNETVEVIAVQEKNANNQIESEKERAAAPNSGVPGVLASALVPIGQISESPLFTPLQLTKIVFLAVILLIVLTLSYDSFVIGNKKTMRLVGENLGHIILFTCVAFLMMLFKGGMIK
jgi:hypothetical protein